LIINILIENQILDVELTSQDENDENISSIGLDLVAGVAEHEVDKEIDEAIEDCNSIKFSNRIHQKVVNDDSESININFDNLHNDSRKVSSLENLNIEIGGNQIIRYSCGNHKLNLA
jgi:O-phosphoseryl-tRNA(Cys) synthetase